jgi:hypothetical protein
MFYVLLRRSPLVFASHRREKRQRKEGAREKTYTPEWENVNSSVEFTICISLRCEYRHRHNLFAIITLFRVVSHTHHTMHTLSLSSLPCVVFTLSYTLHFIHNFKWIFSSLPRTFIQFLAFRYLYCSLSRGEAQKNLTLKSTKWECIGSSGSSSSSKKTCFLPSFCRQLLSCEQHYKHIIFASPSSLMSKRERRREREIERRKRHQGALSHS